MSGPSPRGAGEGPELEGIVGAVGERVLGVIEAAERAAAEVLEDAEAQGRKYLEDARQRADRITLERVEMVSELTDELIEQGHEFRDKSQLMINALEEAVRQLGLGLGEPEREYEHGPAAGRAGEEGLARVSSLDALRTSVERRTEQIRQAPAEEAVPAARSRGSEGARLLATQMAVAGSSRKEIERRLRDEFGIEDPASILEA